MIGYVTLGSNDLPRAAAFFDALFAELGAKRLWDGPTGICWGVSMEQPSVVLVKPYDGLPATRGNGSMVGLAVPHAQDVDRVHARALALGATDEGPAGPRGDTFYCGYFRDLDGNKFNVFCMTTGKA